MFDNTPVGMRDSSLYKFCWSMVHGRSSQVQSRKSSPWSSPGCRSSPVQSSQVQSGPWTAFTMSCDPGPNLLTWSDEFLTIGKTPMLQPINLLKYNAYHRHVVLFRQVLMIMQIHRHRASPAALHKLGQSLIPPAPPPLSGAGRLPSAADCLGSSVSISLAAGSGAWRRFSRAPPPPAALEVCSAGGV